VADLVVVLASSRAGNVTGADFVDGGLIKTFVASSCEGQVNRT
jgi:hypothetical protein